MYQKKQIDIKKEEKLAREKELKIHEDKMHKLNLQVKQFEVKRKRRNFCSRSKSKHLVFLS